VATPDEIVATGLSALGRKPSVIHGRRNVIMTRLIRLLPRAMVMRSAIRYFNRIDRMRPKGEAGTAVRPTQPASAGGRPNWFDNDYSSERDSRSAEELLASIARSPRLIQAVNGAMLEFDSHKDQPGWSGMSRSQLIRKAIAAVLNES
jgi:hypothetical protein